MNSGQWDSLSPLAPTCWVSCHELAESWHYCRPVRDPFAISISITNPLSFSLLLHNTTLLFFKFFLFIATVSYNLFLCYHVPPTDSKHSHLSFMIYLSISLLLSFKKRWMDKAHASNPLPPYLHFPLLPFTQPPVSFPVSTSRPSSSPVKVDARAVWRQWHGHLAMWWMAVITGRRN